MQAVRRLRRITLAPAAVLATVTLTCILSAGQTRQLTKGQQDVSAQCASCHEEIVKQYTGTRHGKADRFAVAGQESCASCHGNVAAHAQSGDPAQISNPRKATAAEASATCLKCHNNQHTQAFWQGNAHETSNVGCLNCHSVHHAKSAEKLLVQRSINELCLTCHTGLRKTQFQRSTHLFRDENRKELITCSECHNPHGSENPKMIRRQSVNDTCFSCHTEKRGPFLWNHSPVQEDCLTCHTPHGSNNVHLLTLRTPQLCQTCHMQGRHQTVAGNANSAWVFNRNCVNCHSQVHGSNHPSGINLQR
jgi:DmsE family decaheme c-type cytochrome